MRMLKPSPGELADRQTILELKIEHADREITDAEPQLVKRGHIVRTVVEGVDKKAPVNHFFDELELIQQHLRNNYVPDLQMMGDEKVSLYDRLYDDLVEANANLWELEDQARVLRAAPDKFEQSVIVRKAEILDLITVENDKRAALVKQINEIWGIKAEEKMYA